MRCDQCEMLSINGVPCHETGCVNSCKTWIEDRQEWVSFLECRDCGDAVESGTICPCHEQCEEAFDYPGEEEQPAPSWIQRVDE